MLLDEIKPYLKELASASHIPGGGAATAVTVAQGLALLSMVCNLTIGKKKFYKVENQVQVILNQLSKLLEKALDETERDMVAFDIVMDAYKMPSDTEEKKIVKNNTLSKATKDATIPPYNILVLAYKAILLAKELEEIGNPSVLSDVFVGRHLLIAGCKSSIENIEANLRNLSQSDPFVKEMRAKVKDCSSFLINK